MLVNGNEFGLYNFPSNPILFPGYFIRVDWAMIGGWGLAFTTASVVVVVFSQPTKKVAKINSAVDIFISGKTAEICVTG